MKHIARSAKLYIRLRNHKQVTFFNRLYSLTLGAWAEVRLHKLLCEPGGFSSTRRNKVLGEDALYDKWMACIALAFQAKYQCSAAALPATAKLRYKAINSFMDNHLKPLITTRNRLAHGQWIYPFKNGTYDIDALSKEVIDKENIMSLQYKKTLLQFIADMVNDLVLSKPTFERDFDAHYKKIEGAERDLSTRTYRDYVSSLIDKHRRGIEKQRIK